VACAAPAIGVAWDRSRQVVIVGKEAKMHALHTLHPRRPSPALVLAAVAALCGQGAWAQQQAGSGLQAPASSWPRVQGRLSVSLPTADRASEALRSAGEGPRQGGASLLGDYYVTGSLLGPLQQGGLRATSGLLYGAGLQTLGGLGGQGFVLQGRGAPATAEPLSPYSSTVPYLGMGYTGVSTRGGWGFSADLGLMALNPGSVVRFGRSGSGSGADDLVRELRLSPLVHLGVSYSF
jgi:hypothetical protein